MLYFRAIQELQNQLKDPQNVLQIKMKPDELLVTNNWRVLHGRNSFTGNRRMLGSYMKMDYFLSKLRILSISQNHQQSSDDRSKQISHSVSHHHHLHHLN